MAAKTILEFTPVLKACDTDLSKCALCEEVIYGKMFRLFLELTEPENKNPTYDSGSDFKLCESCSDFHKDLIR